MTKLDRIPTQIRDAARESLPTIDNVLDELDQKERREYPFSVAQSWKRMAQPGGKPTGLAKAVSDCLETFNPKLRADEWNTYTRAELKILVEQNRVKPFLPDELCKLAEIKKTFNARIAE